MNDVLLKVFSVLFMLLLMLGGRYYRNLNISPSKNLFTGQWQGYVPGVEAFTENQRDYFPQNQVLANICDYSDKHIILAITSKIFPSDYPEIKYLGVKDHFLATFKNKNGPDIKALLILNKASNGKEIKVQILDNGKAFHLKDTSFLLKKTNSMDTCRRRSYFRARFR